MLRDRAEVHTHSMASSRVEVRNTFLSLLAAQLLPYNISGQPDKLARNQGAVVRWNRHLVSEG